MTPRSSARLSPIEPLMPGHVRCRRSDLDRQARKNLCGRQAGARRSQHRCSARPDLRPARAERGRQVDPDQHPRRPGQQERRHRLDLGLRHRPAPAQRQILDRHRPPGDLVRSLLHSVRGARAPGRALRSAEGQEADDGAAPRRPARGQGRRLFADPVGRDEAAAAGRQGDGPFAADPGPRRADRRSRHRASPAALGLCPRAEPATGSRSSSPPIISRKPSNCATGSRSSTTAG